MARIQIERSHGLSRDAIRERAEKLIERLAREYGVSSQWRGDTLVFKRSGADGTLEVSDTTVRVDVKLGILMSAMSGSIEREIEKALDEYLA